ncbi:MAG: hypothetical protein ABIL68_04140 [bacterium]
MNKDIISLVVVNLILVSVFVIMTRLAQFLRKKGGSLTVVTFGATDEFLSRDQKKAIEVIVNRNAGKKEEEQSSSDPKSKENGRRIA